MILQTASAPGTGTISLIAPPTGRSAFSSKFSNGASVFYVADDGTQNEWGYGTLTTGSPDTISRDTVLVNSAGTTAKLNFAGTTKVYNSIPSSNAVFMDKNSVVAITDTTSTGFKTLNVSATSSNNGANILLSGNGATTPNKSIRAKGGNLEVLNHAYGAVLLQVTDAGTLTIVDSSTNNAANLILSATSNAQGACIRLIGNGASTPTKTLRSRNGAFEIINDAYLGIPLTLTDAGALTITGGVTATSGSFSGSVTIGGTTTAAALTTSGLLTANAGITMNSGTAIIGGGGVAISGSSSATTSGWQMISTGTGSLGSTTLNVAVNASGKDVLANRYVAASDGRLKTQIRPITQAEGVKFVRECPGMIYLKGGAWESGHIAQDLITAGFTEVVYRSIDPAIPASANGYSGDEGVRYEVQVGAAQAYLAAALANALDRIEALEARIETLAP